MASASAGQALTHTPQPMQSSGLMASVYFSSLCLPFMGSTAMASGPAAALPRRSGRTGGCRHAGTRTSSWLHSVHFSASHFATDTDDAALLVGGSALLELAVGMVDEHGDRQGVAGHAADGLA